ncbi:MAG TPA: hypothetical protein DEG43_09465 [Acidimicrobiaceae bacterium]|nr:hypothetical protein [Acidimicrobiaceae bacterium]
MASPACAEVYTGLRAGQTAKVDAGWPETPLLIVRCPPAGLAVSEEMDQQWERLTHWCEREGGSILRLRPHPADTEVPMSSLARSDGRLRGLLGGGTGIARAVQLCQGLGIVGIAVEGIDLLDAQSAAVLHHLIDIDHARCVASCANDAPLPAQILALVVTDQAIIVDLEDLDHRGEPSVTPEGPESHEALAQLTTREQEILEFVDEGWRNREIADRLCLSVRTVEGHVLRLCRKFGVQSRSELSARTSRIETGDSR